MYRQACLYVEKYIKVSSTHGSGGMCSGAHSCGDISTVICCRAEQLHPPHKTAQEIAPLQNNAKQTAQLHNIVEKTATLQKIVEQSTPKQDMADQSSPKQNMADQSDPKQNILEQSALKLIGTDCSEIHWSRLLRNSSECTVLQYITGYISCVSVIFLMFNMGFTCF